MAKQQLNMFSAMRSSFQEQQELTVQSMNAYGGQELLTPPQYWGIKEI